MDDRYANWIRRNILGDMRGKCFEMTLWMAEAFPELVRVSGHYVCPVSGRRPHWWLVDQFGNVVDPTASQFAPCGDYEPWEGQEPTGKCLNCGGYIFCGDVFCCDECAEESVSFMNRRRSNG